MRDVLLDVRDLEPPEPMERALEALAVLGPQERLRMRIGREPRLLYPILVREGYRYEASMDEDGVFDVRIWRDAPG